jgi:hypothetical protein
VSLLGCFLLLLFPGGIRVLLVHLANRNMGMGCGALFWLCLNKLGVLAGKLLTLTEPFLPILLIWFILRIVQQKMRVEAMDFHDPLTKDRSSYAMLHDFQGVELVAMDVLVQEKMA